MFQDEEDKFRCIDWVSSFLLSYDRITPLFEERIALISYLQFRIQMARNFNMKYFVNYLPSTSAAIYQSFHRSKVAFTQHRVIAFNYTQL